MFPMLTGLTALHGNGYIVPLVDDYGKATRGLIGDGVFMAFSSDSKNGAPIARLNGWKDMPWFARIPVAVLTDDGNASSDEAVALAFSAVRRPDLLAQKQLTKRSRPSS